MHPAPPTTLESHLRVLRLLQSRSDAHVDERLCVRSDGWGGFGLFTSFETRSDNDEKPSDHDGVNGVATRSMEGVSVDKIAEDGAASSESGDLPIVHQDRPSKSPASDISGDADSTLSSIIEAGSPLILIPRSLMLHGPEIVPDEVLTSTGLNLTEFRGAVTALKLVAAARDAARGDGIVGMDSDAAEVVVAYLRSLPTTNDLLHLPRSHAPPPSTTSPTFDLFTPLFRPSPVLLRSFVGQTSSLHRLFELSTTHPALLQFLPEGHDPPSWQEYRWAWCIIQSRAIGLWYGPTLVPFVDLLNHSHPPNVVCFPMRSKPNSFEDAPEELALSFESIGDLEPGTELLWNYSSHSDDVGWLLGYGFVPADGRSSGAVGAAETLAVEGNSCEVDQITASEVEHRLKMYYEGLSRTSKLLSGNVEALCGVPRTLVEEVQKLLEREKVVWEKIRSELEQARSD